MAFKSINDYNEERFGGLFLLRNDGDYADVIFLYRSLDDVLVADTHYVKSSDYSGYVHCCGKNCPACEKGIRIQTKLFIPMYNISNKAIEFWDRNVRFENQLSKDVFENYPNPSEFVFRITRHGVAGDVNTSYEIRAIGRNSKESYETILDKFNISLPEHYETVCKDISESSLRTLLSSGSSSQAVYGSEDLPAYQATPRVSTEGMKQADLDSIDSVESVPEFSDDDDLEEVDF